MSSSLPRSINVSGGMLWQSSRPSLLTGGSGWWSLFMAPPLPHFGRSYGRISWRLWKPSERSPYFSTRISTLLWKRQIVRMTLEVSTLDPNNSGLAWGGRIARDGTVELCLHMALLGTSPFALSCRQILELIGAPYRVPID